MFLLGINASAELARYYSRTNPLLTSSNGITLLLGFVYEKKKNDICKFWFLQELKQTRFVLIKQTQTSYKTTELMDVNLAF